MDPPRSRAHSGARYHTISSSTTILPPSSIRDIVALIFVLLLLPQLVSCVFLTTYILLGSSKCIGGKFLAKHFFLRDVPARDFDFHRVNTHYTSKLVGFSLQLFSINSLVLLVLYYVFPESWLLYLVVLAKSIIASELIGSSATSSTTITSITSTTATSPGPANNGPSTTTTTTTTTKRSSRSDTSYFSSHFVNSVVCFVSVLYINYVIRDWLLEVDFSEMSFAFSDVLAAAQKYAKSPSLILLKSLELESSSYSYNEYNYDSSELLSDQSGVFRTARLGLSPFLQRLFASHLPANKSYFSKPSAGFVNKVVMHSLIHNFDLSDSTISRVSSTLRRCCAVVNYVYLVLCIHVIILTISPVLARIFLLEGYSKTLDDLSNLTPNIPVEFRKKAPLPITGAVAESAEPIIVNVELLTLNLQTNSVTKQQFPEITEFMVDENVANSLLVQLSSDKPMSVAAKNFETFCVTPFTNKVSNLLHAKSASKITNLIDHGHLAKKTPSLSSTTIVDRNLVNTITIQPFWSLLAAAKIMLKNPKLFAGNPTKTKNNGSSFTSSCFSSVLLLKLATTYIDHKSVVLKVLDVPAFEELVSRRASVQVRINGVDWSFVEPRSVDVQSGTPEIFINIYGLTPLFQYEIDFYEQENNGHETLLGHVLVNTVSSSPQAVLNVSPEISSVSTLKGSLMSTIDNLNEMKTRSKKIKKEENRKNAELKKDIDNLKSKIFKYSSKQASDSRVSGKLKGLQHSVIQLEHEIEELKEKVKDTNSSQEQVESSYKDDESKLLKDIQELEAFTAQYDMAISKQRASLKTDEFEEQQLFAKNRKLVSKKQAREEELTRLYHELRALKKNGLIGKINRKTKKVHERYETVLPKVLAAKDDLEKEFEELLLSTGIKE